MLTVLTFVELFAEMQAKTPQYRLVPVASHRSLQPQHRYCGVVLRSVDSLGGEDVLLRRYHSDVAETAKYIP